MVICYLDDDLFPHRLESTYRHTVSRLESSTMLSGLSTTRAGKRGSFLCISVAYQGMAGLNFGTMCYFIFFLRFLSAVEDWPDGEVSGMWKLLLIVVWSRALGWRTWFLQRDRLNYLINLRRSLMLAFVDLHRQHRYHHIISLLLLFLSPVI